MSEPGPSESRSAAVDTVDTGESVVRCEQVDRIFAGSRRRFGGHERQSVTALEAVSFEAAPGEFVGIRGPSGSGKSTLLHLLAALDVPTSGQVFVGEQATDELSERARTQLRLEQVGIVFQRFHLLPSLSARANVALPLLERGVRKQRRRERAADLLERVDLGDRVSHHPGELSGGEQQRVAIARALVNDPSLLIADEPTGELDRAATDRVLGLLDEVAERRAVVVASHDEAVWSAADRVVELRDGRVVERDG